MNLLFDLDGTLTDPKEGITASIRFAMQGLGMPLGAEVDLDWCIGPPLQQSFAKLLGLPERSADSVLARWGSLRTRFTQG